MLSLNIEKREIIGKASSRLPVEKLAAVFYGHTVASTPITVDKRDFIKIYKQAGESTVVTLTGLGKDVSALINNVEFDPVTNIVRHVDFYAFEKGQKVEVDIPLEFTGTAPALKLNGIVVKVMRELKVEASPADLPHEINVDLSTLVDLDSHITVKDLVLPKGVTALDGADEIVAAISTASEEKEEATTVDLSAIEVEKKGKKEETETEEDK